MRRIARDARGATALEFAMLAPVFLGVLFAVIDGGYLLWTQLGMQHAVESAARCAAINATTCGNATAIQNYAATQAYGLGLPSNVYSFSMTGCGYQVAANTTFVFFSNSWGAASIPVNASACFPN